MAAQPQTTTPAEPLHRIRKPLNWSRSKGATDGLVRSRVDNGVLPPQPGQRARGVSFLALTPEGWGIIHQHLGKQLHGCAVTVPNTQLPQLDAWQLLLVDDGPLKAPIPGEAAEQTITVGNHYTLYGNLEMPATVFEQLYEQLMSTCLSYGEEAGAGPASLTELDEDRMPTDKLSYVAVTAMEAWAATTDNLNTARLATVFAWHIRATSMPFPKLLEAPYLANMVAAALDRYTARDYLVYADAREAQSQLAATLEDYDPIETNFVPHWVSCSNCAGLEHHLPLQNSLFTGIMQGV